MIVIGAVLTLVLSFLVVIAVVAPKIKKRRKQKTAPLSLPAPDTPREKMKKKIENKWILSGKNWCEFYKSLGVTSSRKALWTYYPYEPPHPKHKNFKNEEEFIRASVIYNFINNKKEEGVDVECRNKTQ